jgi:hypothetical protein
MLKWWKMRKQNKPRFNEILLSSIDESLVALGESIKTSVYFHMEATYNIKKDQIPNNLEKFSDGLEKIFGVGARYLEVLFMKELYLKLKENSDWSDAELAVSEVKFSDYVTIVKNKYEKNRVV